MDYDKTNMATHYDAGRAYSPAALDHWLKTIARFVAGRGISVIVDLGCGTGRYSEALAAFFNARVVAIDPSDTMLAEARKKATGRVTYAKGCGEQLPLADACADLVFISMVFHHFADRTRAARECRRVLRPDGVACLRAGTTDRIGTYAYVPFFASSPAILKKDLQSSAAIEATFAEAGLRLVRHEVIDSELAPDWCTYAAKLTHRADSVLRQLPDDEFEQGLANLRDYAKGVLGAVIEPIDFFAFAHPAEMDHSTPRRATRLPDSAAIPSGLSSTP